MAMGYGSVQRQAAEAAKAEKSEPVAKAAAGGYRADEKPPAASASEGAGLKALFSAEEAEANAKALEKACRWLSTARAILVGVGAGMGVDSGLGTYRGAKMGVWPPLKALGIDYREICTPDALAEHPQLTWAFWRYCILAYRSAQPHDGYSIIKKWISKARLGGFCYTTNVDAMWPRILPAELIYEVHGSTNFLQCSNARGDCPGKGEVWSCPEDFVDQLPLEESKDDSVEFAALPRCAACGKLARVNVNMFGDFDFSKKRGRIQKASYQQWLQSVDADLNAELDLDAEETQAQEDDDASAVSVPKEPSAEKQLLLAEHPVVCLEIGAGTSIPTVRTALEGRAKRPGHVLVRINPENFALPVELEADGCAVAISLPAAEALRLIDERMAALS